MRKKNIKYGKGIIFCTISATLIMLAKLSGVSKWAERYGGIAVTVLVLAILIFAIAERRNLK